MKNKTRGLLLLSAALLLASCAGGESSSSSSETPASSDQSSSLSSSASSSEESSQSSSQESSSSSEIVSSSESSSSSQSSSSSEESSSSQSSSSIDGSAQKAAFEAFLTSLSGKNATVASQSLGLTNYYLGSDAYYLDYGSQLEASGYESYGYIKNSEGMWEYSIADETVVLGNCYSPNTEIDIYDDIIYSIVDLADSASYWEQDDSDPSTFVFSYSQINYYYNTAYRYALLALCSFSSMSSTYYSMSTLTLSEDGNSATLNNYFGTDTTNYVDTLTISNIGTTALTAVTNYLANPVLKATPTDWSEDEKDLLGEMFTATTLPAFPNGYISKYSEMADNREDYGTIDVYDFGSSAAMAAGIAAFYVSEGYTIDETNSSYGDSVTSPTYVLIAAAAADGEEWDGATYYEISLSYVPANETGYSEYYPNGYLMLSFYKFTVANSLETVNAVLAETSIDYYSGTKLPAFDESDLISSINLTDYTSDYSSYFNERGYYLYVYYVIMIDFTENTTQEQAQAYLDSWRESIGVELTQNGYVYSDAYKEFQVVIEPQFDSNSAWTNSYEIDIIYTD